MVLSVSALNSQIKSLLENTFVQTWVEGEISNLTHHTSGHIYFSIKDENSTLSCVMFRGNASKLKFRFENGLKVLLDGGISVYVPRGNYQFIVSDARPSGIGDLALAYEQTKKKLEALGYFDISRKKSLPKFPQKVALITSKTGAAIEDMKRVAEGRWPLTRFTLFNVLVQGEESASSIAKAIEKADTLGFDVLVVGRGGGSKEDLWAFNEECVAHALYCAKTPTISAVGHEIDVLISDFVADVRAATPSNAIEILLPDQKEAFLFLGTLEERFKEIVKTSLTKKREELGYIKERFFTLSLKSRLSHYTESLQSIKTQFHVLAHMQLAKATEKNFQKRKEFITTLAHTFERKTHELILLKEQFEQFNPNHKEFGNHAQIVVDNRASTLENLPIGKIFELQTPHIKAQVQLLSKEHIV